MKCSNCGNEVAKGAKFCGSCGQTIISCENAENVASGKSKKKRMNSILAIIGVICVAFVINSLAHRTTKIELEKYIIVQEEGYDGYGTVHLSFDWERLFKDYDKKIKMTDEGKQYMRDTYGMEMNDSQELQDFVKSRIYFVQENIENASNGSNAASQICVDKELRKEFWEFDIIYPEVFVKEITQLTKVEKIDVFENLKVEFWGASGNAKLVYEYLGRGFQTSDFEADSTIELIEGDRINISIEEESIERCVMEYGLTPEQTEKTYTVTGLGTYITSVGDISTSSLGEMRKQAETVAMESQDEWGFYEDNIKKMTYLGTYFANLNISEDYQDKNALFLVYQIDVEVMIDDLTEIKTFYWYIKYNDMCVDKEGTVKIDVVSDWSRVQSNLYIGDYVVQGFETLEELEDDIQYDYEDYIVQKSIVSTGA